jgi:hypothetical protein
MQFINQSNIVKNYIHVETHGRASHKYNTKGRHNNLSAFMGFNLEKSLWINNFAEIEILTPKDRMVS